MGTTERLFLLDGMALAYRAYFSFITRPLINSKGVNTSAVYGFVTALMKILEDERPEHIAVVFDTKEPTFRHKLYQDYKATRQKMPEDMAAQMEKLKEVVRAFNTPLLELPGFEADDIIGTLARRAEREGILTMMVTGDKDFMQLISPLIKMYKPGKSGGEPEMVEEAGVKEKFGVTPDRVIDVLGLIGDKSDNVPGVPGVGEKTAIPLIQKYGSMEELYAHVAEIPHKGLREKLLTHREKALLSKHLVTIDTAVPIDVDIHALRAARRDTGKLIALFGELEFRSLAGRLRDTEDFQAPPAGTPAGQEAGMPGAPAGTAGAAPALDITTDAHEYTCVTSASALDALVAELMQSPLVVFDTETTSKDPLRADLVGISLSNAERRAWYIPVRWDPATAREPGVPGGELGRTNNTDGALPREAVLKAVAPLFASPRVRKAGQNVKYDMLVLMNHGLEVHGIEFDTMVASYILRADGQHNLDALAAEYLNYRMVAFEEVVGKGKQARHITEVPLASLADYSAEDADMTFRIRARQLRPLEEMDLRRLCDEVEFPLIGALARMEMEGIALDVPCLTAMSADMQRQLATLVEKIHTHAGGPFNINSTPQLRDVLFTRLKLPTARKTKTGFSTDVAVLETLHGMHPIIDCLLEYRQLTKLKSTYVDALPSLINPATGRLHTSFNQTVAATGRLSSSDPNLQNIPIRTEAGRRIRQAFIPRAGGAVLMSADYSQIELRVMAHMSGDEGLTAAFRNGEDIHATTASRVFGVSAGEVSRDMRRKAKEVNFGIIYGIGPFGLAGRLEITQTEAKEIIARYFDRFPKVRQYINDTIAGARRNGYVATLMGRRRYLPEIASRNQNIRGNAERQAINMPIQGTAADMIKIAMIQVDGGIREAGLRSRMLLQVHDELLCEVPAAEVQAMEALLRERMQNAMPLAVPVSVDVGTGKNWLEAH
ncbi:MAG TPA: DNA polymerase I [Bacteroidota bacterium]|nr:DNA polymerase I [Bacteroidota bacterium]